MILFVFNMKSLYFGVLFDGKIPMERGQYLECVDNKLIQWNNKKKEKKYNKLFDIIIVIFSLSIQFKDMIIVSNWVISINWDIFIFEDAESASNK